jgi:hypothetical protein
MILYARTAAFAVILTLWCVVPASAESMRCQSVNGNLNCAGSNGVACQEVNGKKTCVSGHGDVVQSFGKGTSSTSTHSATQGQDDAMDRDDAMDQDDDADTTPPHPARPHADRGSSSNPR